MPLLGQGAAFITQGSQISDGVISNNHVASNAAVDFSKLAALTDGNILVGSAANVATSVNPSGDVDISNAGALTVQANAVTPSKISAALRSGAWQEIGDTTLGADAASVQFSSIAAGFLWLKLLMHVKTSGAGVQTLNIQFNTDAATTYTAESIEWTGAASAFQNLDVAGSIRLAAIDANPASEFSDIEALIGNHTNGRKTLKARWTRIGASTHYDEGGVWPVNTEISDILISPSGDNLLAGTRISLHGIPL